MAVQRADTAVQRVKMTASERESPLEKNTRNVSLCITELRDTLHSKQNSLNKMANEVHRLVDNCVKGALDAALDCEEEAIYYSDRFLTTFRLLEESRAETNQIQIQLQHAKEGKEKMEGQLNDVLAQEAILAKRLREANEGKTTVEVQLKDALEDKKTAETQLIQARETRKTIYQELLAEQLKRKQDIQKENLTLKECRNELHVLRNERTEAKVALGIADESTTLNQAIHSVMLSEKTLKCEIDELKVERVSAERKLDDLKAEKASAVRERDDLKAERASAERERDDLKTERASAQRELEELKAERASAELAANKEIRNLEATRDALLPSAGQLVVVQTKKRKWKQMFTATEEENVRLRNSEEVLRITAEATGRELEKEQEKSVCHICFVRTKDALLLPCLHLHFCHHCLDEFFKTNKTCPSCRSNVQEVLNCKT